MTKGVILTLLYSFLYLNDFWKKKHSNHILMFNPLNKYDLEHKLHFFYYKLLRKKYLKKFIIPLKIQNLFLETQKKMNTNIYLFTQRIKANSIFYNISSAFCTCNLHTLIANIIRLITITSSSLTFLSSLNF